VENVDLKDIRSKQDQTNKVWVSKKYWDKEKKGAEKAAEFDSKYKVLVAELVLSIHGLREKKEVVLPGYVLSVVQAEMEFYRKSLDELVKCESTLRSLGRVEAIKFTGHDQFAVGRFQTEASTGSMSNREPSPRPVVPPAQPAAIPSRPTLPRAKGLYVFQGQSPDELSFNPDDVLNIVSQDGEWWTAELNGRKGLVPANYVKLI